MESLIINNCKVEIIQLHDWFSDWFNGSVKNNNSNLEEFSSVLNENFHLITPNGELIAKKGLIERIKNSHSSKSQVNNFNITVEHITIRNDQENFVVVSYVEHQNEGNTKSKRLSSVIFKKNPMLRNQLEWIHVHETWI